MSTKYLKRLYISVTDPVYPRPSLHMKQQSYVPKCAAMRLTTGPMRRPLTRGSPMSMASARSLSRARKAAEMDLWMRRREVELQIWPLVQKLPN